MIDLVKVFLCSLLVTNAPTNSGMLEVSLEEPWGISPLGTKEQPKTGHASVVAWSWQWWGVFERLGGQAGPREIATLFSEGDEDI